MAKPIYKVRSGNVSAAVWQSNKDDGKTNLSFTVEKQYKTQGGEYKKTEFFFLNEAANLMAIAVKLLSYDPFANTKPVEAAEEASTQEVPGESEIPF